MEPVFVLPYPEFAVANEIQSYLRPKDGYSVLIPLSRQQKGFDLIIYNKKSNRLTTIQIKNSRVWTKKPPKRRGKKERFQIYSWFNKFKYEKNLANYYILFMLYPKTMKRMGKLSHTRNIKKWYDIKLLIFSDEKIGDFLRNLDDKRFFGFGYNSNSKDIFLTRGLKNKMPSYKEYLFEKKISEIKKKLD